MNEETKKRLYWLCGVLLAIFVLFLWPHTLTWDGDGTINVFPSTSSVKNYRLSASMTVTRKMKGYLNLRVDNYYSDILGTWPNGGYLDLSGCEIKNNSQSFCFDQEGVTYSVEVNIPPDAPEYDYSANN